MCGLSTRVLIQEIHSDIYSAITVLLVLLLVNVQVTLASILQECKRSFLSQTDASLYSIKSSIPDVEHAS